MQDLKSFEHPETQTKTVNGWIEGVENQGTIQFLGIPYAQAVERFVPAKPVKPWDGVFHADHYGKISYQGTLFGQKSKNGPENSNDCQNLNLWTPALDQKKRAVMVWLHGGGFSTGSANEAEYNGANLAKNQDVVVVGVNHRLNAFGFLNLSSFGAKYVKSANVGMLDIVMALQWIRDNIADFGGDPTNVTVFGQSGGGCKCLVLMASPAANGLFHKVIAESAVTHKMGITLTPASVTRKIGEKTVELLGLDAETIESIQSIEATKIIDAAYQARLAVGKEVGEKLVLSEEYGIEWEPSTQTEFLPEGFFLPDGFTKNAPGVPLLMGSNFTEMNKWVPFLQHTDPIVAENESFAYAYPERPAGDIRYCDCFIRIPTLKVLLHRSLQETAPVYAYLFNQGQYPVHGSEIPYVFDQNKTPLADQISQCWASFAKTGQPECDSIPGWDAFDKENGACMILEDQSRLAFHHDTKLMEEFDPNFNFQAQK